MRDKSVASSSSSGVDQEGSTARTEAPASGPLDESKHLREEYGVVFVRREDALVLRAILAKACPQPEDGGGWVDAWFDDPFFAVVRSLAERIDQRLPPEDFVEDPRQNMRTLPGSGEHA